MKTVSAGLRPDLEGGAFLELLIEESWDVTPTQKLRQLVASVHSVDHEYRCRKRISSHLHVLDLITHGIKETIAENYGSPILEVIH